MKNKVALVTGAAAGIGASCAKRLAEDGVSVGVLDLDAERCADTAAAIQQAGGKAIALGADVSDREQVRAALDNLRAEFGPVNIVVNNAGITGFTPFAQITDEEWDRMYRVNVKSIFIIIQEVLEDMKKENWGRIVNISSSSAQTGAPNMAHYSSSKGAVITLTRTLAQELGSFGITVNNIPPGSVMRTIMSEANREKWNITDDQLRASIPAGRVGEPEDIANACAWLCLEASSYVTGQTIGVNGGRVVS